VIFFVCMCVSRACVSARKKAVARPLPQVTVCLLRHTLAVQKKQGRRREEAWQETQGGECAPHPLFSAAPLAALLLARRAAAAFLALVLSPPSLPLTRARPPAGARPAGRGLARPGSWQTPAWRWSVRVSWWGMGREKRDERMSPRFFALSTSPLPPPPPLMHDTSPRARSLPSFALSLSSLGDVVYMRPQRVCRGCAWP